MNDDEAFERAVEVMKPFVADIAPGAYTDDILDAVAKAIKQAYADGWDRGTR